MGKHKDCRTCVFRCVVFNLQKGTNSDLIYTDLYLTKNCNTVTLTWCAFGGTAFPDQKSTTAQNKEIPYEFLPPGDQSYVISGEDSGVGTRNMKLTITKCGKIIFTFSVSGDETAGFPVIHGSSVSWVTFNEC